MRSLAVFKVLGLAAAAFMAGFVVACGDEPDASTKDEDPSGSVTWCEVSTVLAQKCRSCHVGQGLNGAPFPLVTFDDTQVLHQAIDKRRWELMQDMVEEDLMPPNDPRLEPPPAKLTDAQKALLLTWFSEGAQAVGGTDCD